MIIFLREQYDFNVKFGIVVTSDGYKMDQYKYIMNTAEGVVSVLV